MSDLSGRVALVTGSAGAIGHAVVKRLRSARAQVAGLDICESSAVDLSLVADLRSMAAVLDAEKRLRDAIGAADILVHSAAIQGGGGCLDTDPDQFLDTYDVNVVGALRLIQRCAPSMQAKGTGSIVLLSSINAAFATPTLAAYAASKAALESLVRTAALELAPSNVRVNAVAPASVDTAMLREALGSESDLQAALARNAFRHPIARLGTPDEVADLVYFLVSDQSRWITGAIVPLDGGAHVTRR